MSEHRHGDSELRLHPLAVGRDLTIRCASELQRAKQVCRFLADFGRREAPHSAIQLEHFLSRKVCGEDRQFGGVSDSAAYIEALCWIVRYPEQLELTHC